MVTCRDNFGAKLHRQTTAAKLNLDPGQSNSVFSAFNLRWLAAIQWLTSSRQIPNRVAAAAVSSRQHCSVVGICVHVHLVLFDFVGKVCRVEDNKTRT